MMWLFAAILSAVVFGIGGFLLKVGSHKNYPSPSMFLGLYLAGSAIFLGTYLVGDEKKISLDWLFVLFSLLVGLGSYYGNSFMVKAYDLGPACLTSPLMSLNIFFVILLSSFFYHETITQWQYVGVACMMGAISLLGFNLNNTVIKSKMWIVFVVLAILFIFMREGGMKVAFETGLNNLGILFFAYLFASVLALFQLLKHKHNHAVIQLELANLKNAPANHRQAFLLGSTIGIFSSIGMALFAYAITRGPASVIVPIFSTRNFVAVILLAFFFKEKLSLLQWFAVGLLILGILFIS